MDDRAEFEQWAAERYEGQFRRNLDGDYCNVRLCEGWETWQAATARQRERDAEARLGLEAITEALKEPAGGSWHPLRKFCNERNIYNEDIADERVLCRVAQYVLDLLPAEAIRRQP